MAARAAKGPHGTRDARERLREINPTGPSGPGPWATDLPSIVDPGHLAAIRGAAAIGGAY